MRKVSSLILVLLVFSTRSTIAQEAIFSDPCPFPDLENFAQVSERMICMEDRFNELRQTQNLLLRTQQNLIKQLEETAAKIDYNIYGPPKDLERFPAVKLAVTHGYWDGGNQVQSFNCVPPLESKPGKTLIDGALSDQVSLIIGENVAEYGGNSRGCAPDSWCNGHGEFCRVQSRAAGCYVSTAWYTWYTDGQHRKNLPISQIAVCAD